MLWQHSLMQWVGRSISWFAVNILCASRREFHGTKHCAGSSGLTAIFLELYGNSVVVGTTATLGIKAEITCSPRDQVDRFGSYVSIYIKGAQVGNSKD